MGDYVISDFLYGWIMSVCVKHYFLHSENIHTSQVIWCQGRENLPKIQKCGFEVGKPFIQSRWDRENLDTIGGGGKHGSEVVKIFIQSGGEVQTSPFTIDQLRTILWYSMVSTVQYME